MSNGDELLRREHSRENEREWMLRQQVEGLQQLVERLRTSVVVLLLQAGLNGEAAVLERVQLARLREENDQQQRLILVLTRKNGHH